MCKVYINNVAVVLTTPQTDLPPQSRQCVQLSYQSGKDMLDIIRYIEANSTELQTVFVVGKTQQQVKNDFFTHYQAVYAAGGLVHNTQQQVLLIRRNKHWDLPKGKAERNETTEQTALREVSEETGLQQLHITQPIFIPDNNDNLTYHTYYDKQSRVIKITHWYAMYCPQYTDSELRPQAEEGITEVVWVAPSLAQTDHYLQSSYGSIKDVLRSALS